MIGRFAYDASAAAIGTILGLMIFTGWAIWHKRATVLLAFALGVGVTMALSGCAVTKTFYDAARDGAIR